MFSAGEGAGASGSFFFFSFDQRFLIKTVTKEEKLVLDKVMPEYMEHLMKMRNQSMMARIYGLFTIKTNYFEPLEVMVMQNTFKSSNDSDCVLKFDIKGSIIARNVANITSEAVQSRLSKAKSEQEFFELV